MDPTLLHLSILAIWLPNPYPSVSYFCRGTSLHYLATSSLLSPDQGGRPRPTMPRRIPPCPPPPRARTLAAPFHARRRAQPRPPPCPPSAQARTPVATPVIRTANRLPVAGYGRHPLPLDAASFPLSPPSQSRLLSTVYPASPHSSLSSRRRPLYAGAGRHHRHTRCPRRALTKAGPSPLAERLLEG